MTRRGFTLLELMISLTVGGIAITSIYSIGATATRTFHQQQQIASTQTALRNAVNQVKRDIARAGYLFTPIANSPAGYVQQACAPVSAPLDAPLVSGSLAAISRYTDDLAATVANNNTGIDPTGLNAQNGFTNDELVMFGNYETTAEYAGVTLLNSTTIAIDQNWQSFQRDFTDWPNGNTGVLDMNRFNEAFAVGRMIRIQTSLRRRHYATIVRVIAPANVAGTDDVRVVFSPSVPIGCDAEVNGGWVAPVSALRYFVRDAPAAENPRIAANGPMAQLIRSEVDPNDKATPLATNAATGTRAVLDYVVAFNLAFTMNTATAPGQPDSYVPGSRATSAAIVNANPERVRAVAIELAVRSPEQDPTLPWVQANCAGVRCFQVFSSTGTGAVQGSARVRREHAEVFLPNVAFEGY